MSPAYNEALCRVAQAARAAGHGGKGVVYERACADLGVSRAKLLRDLKEATVTDTRKRRSDAGASALTRDEAEILSASWMETIRANGKRQASLAGMLEMLRGAGEILAGSVDPDTGVITHLSESAVAKALRSYGLHPEQLRRPGAAIPLASKHPNDVWEIDASLCVLYYLPQAGKDSGLRIMGDKEFYKNKPANLRKIERERIWRYVITDHASGTVYVRYVLGAESGENLTATFIEAIQQRGSDPFYGVPYKAMLDPGSANTGALFKSLCKCLQLRVITNEPGNPRAKGQVEQANNLVEREFEPSFRFMASGDLDAINAHAATWMRWFNGSRIHSRHGMTRFEAWQKITPEQLRLAPPAEICRELVRSGTEDRTVDGYMHIEFKGRTFDVSGIPGLNVKDKILVAQNPWRPDCAQVVMLDEEGREIFHVLEALPKDDFGFPAGAAVIGEEFKSRADTPADTNRKRLERLVMGADTDEKAKAARKAKRLPFGGRIDPLKPMRDGAASLPAYMPKAGTDLGVKAPHVELPRMSAMAAAKQLRERIGEAWQPDYYARLTRDYPDGLTEDDLEAALQALARPAGETKLRAVS